MTIRVSIEAHVEAGQVREWGIAGVQEVAKMGDDGTLQPFAQPIAVDQCIAVTADFLKSVALQKAQQAHERPSGILVAG